MHATAAVEVDDDVSVAAIDTSSGQSDVAGVFDAGAEATLLEGVRHALGVGYDFHQSLYSDLSDADLQMHTLSLTGFRELEGLEFGLDYRFYGARLGTQGFFLAHELVPGVGVAVGPSWFVSLAYGLQDTDFLHDDPRDAIRHDLLLRSFWLLAERVKSLSLLYRFRAENSDGAEFRYRGHAAGLILSGLRLGWRVEAELGYRFESRDYLATTVSIGEPRFDWRHRLEVGLERPLPSLGPFSMAARVGYEFFVSESNLPEADYSNNIVSLGIACEW